MLNIVMLNVAGPSKVDQYRGRWVMVQHLFYHCEQEVSLNDNF